MRRWIRRHRRPLAAMLLAVAAGLAVDAVTAEPPPGEPVVVAARDLPAGEVLAVSDLATVPLPPDAVPDGTMTAADAAGRRLSSPARKGEPLTDARLAGRAQLLAAPAGTVAVPVPVSDPATLSVVRAGDAVRVIAGSGSGDELGLGGSEPARVLVRRAVVLSTPQPAGGGLLDGGASGVLLLAMTTEEAVDVADAAQGRYLAFALLP